MSLGEGRGEDGPGRHRGELKQRTPGGSREAAVLTRLLPDCLHL